MANAGRKPKGNAGAKCWACGEHAELSLHGVPICREMKCKSKLRIKAAKMAHAELDEWKPALQRAYIELARMYGQDETIKPEQN